MALAAPDAGGRLLDVRDMGTLDFTPAAADHVCRAISRRGDLVDRDPPESTFAFAATNDLQKKTPGRYPGVKRFVSTWSLVEVMRGA